MKKEIFNEIEIPEGVEVTIGEDGVLVKGSEGENKRKFSLHGITLEKKENKIVIGDKKITKKEKKMMNTITRHIKNMIKGVQEKFEYKSKICFSHFPITVDLNGNQVTIKNFLGEKIPRKLSLPEGVETEIAKDIITFKSVDKELAGQAAASLESITRITDKDKRIFQDGIWIISKCGRAM